MDQTNYGAPGFGGRVRTLPRYEVDLASGRFPRVLLLGNGILRLRGGVSWEALLQRIAVNDEIPDDVLRDIPLAMRVEALCVRILPKGSPKPTKTAAATEAPTPVPTSTPKPTVAASGDDDDAWEDEEAPVFVPANDEAEDYEEEEEIVVEPQESKPPIGLHSRDEEGETAVRKLQARLNELGYLEQEPDGDFGSKTLKALKRYQKENDLEQTGVLDEETALLLYPQPKVTTAPEDVMYAEGAHGKDIRMVQRRLRQYGFYTRAISGQYDEYTTDMVRDFQEYAVENYGTEYDEPVQTQLLEEPALSAVSMLDSEDDPSVQFADDLTIPEMPALAPEATLRPHHALDGVVSENLYEYLKDDRFPTYHHTVQKGDTGIEVERVQRRLTTLDFYYEDITGEYDEHTAQALKSFQKRNDLQETGIADEETQRQLFSEEPTGGERVEQPFYIKVSISDQQVYVYRWSDGGYNQLIKTMICSTGFGNSTPRGVFVSPGHRDARWHYFAEFNCWAQYAFIIKGSILFHSVIFSRKDEGSLRQSTLRNLGRKASHGCVRLKVEDAKWIYENCGAGQVIEIY